MQLFLADCQFPDIENQVKAYQLFVEAWENGEIAKSDKTDKFEMLFRVHASILLHGEPNLAFIWNLLL